MRVFRSSLFSIALALLVAGPAQAQLTCDELVFDAEARANYPEVNEACLEVVVRDGANYARFHARVIQPGSNSIGIQYEHRDGTWGEPKTVTLPEDFRFMIDGRPTPSWDLEVWQELNIYLQEGRWRLAITDLAPVEALEVYPEPLPQIAAPEVIVPDPPEEAAVEPEPQQEAAEPQQEAVEPEQEAVEPVQAPVEQPAEAEPPEEGGSSKLFLLLGGFVLFLIAVVLMKRRKE